MLVPEVTCYCDIPYDHLGPHVFKYGSFQPSSVGITRQMGGETRGLRRSILDDWQVPFTGGLLFQELKATSGSVRAYGAPTATERTTLTRPKSSAERHSARRSTRACGSGACLR